MAVLPVTKQNFRRQVFLFIVIWYRRDLGRCTFIEGFSHYSAIQILSFIGALVSTSHSRSLQLPSFNINFQYHLLLFQVTREQNHFQLLAFNLFRSWPNRWKKIYIRYVIWENGNNGSPSPCTSPPTLPSMYELKPEDLKPSIITLHPSFCLRNNSFSCWQTWRCARRDL